MSLCANVRRLGLSSRRLASDPARARLHQPRKLLQILVPEEVILVRCGDYSARKGVFAYERPGKTVIVTCVDAACSGEESVVQTSKALSQESTSHHWRAEERYWSVLQERREDSESFDRHAPEENSTRGR